MLINKMFLSARPYTKLSSAEFCRYGILATVFAIVALSAGACSSGGVDCVNRILREEASPGGDYKTVVYKRVCGADSTLNVSLLAVDTPLPAAAGNVFVASLDDRGVYLGDGTELRLTWRTAKSLLIRAHASLTIRKSVKRFEGIMVSYQYFRF